LLYDLESGRFEPIDSQEAPLDLAPAERRALLDRVIWNWEALRLAREPGSS
jgi:hypothetical protein